MRLFSNRDTMSLKCEVNVAGVVCLLHNVSHSQLTDFKGNIINIDVSYESGYYLDLYFNYNDNISNIYSATDNIVEFLVKRELYNYLKNYITRHELVVRIYNIIKAAENDMLSLKEFLSINDIRLYILIQNDIYWGQAEALLQLNDVVFDNTVSVKNVLLGNYDFEKCYYVNKGE